MKRQVNRMIVRLRADGKTEVKAPDGRVLQEFEDWAAALSWASSTLDFVRKKSAGDDA